MSLFPEFHEDDFSVMVDPNNGRVALICPAPIITFDDISEFRGWLCYLLEMLPQLTRATETGEPTMLIEKDYAASVIDGWQTQILENLKMSPKKRGIRKSAKMPENFTSEE